MPGFSNLRALRNCTTKSSEVIENVDKGAPLRFGAQSWNSEAGITMTRSKHSGLTCRLFSADWWVRLLALVLFAGSVNYERAHLSLDAHLDAVPMAYSDNAGFEASSQEEDHHHHDAHPAWEHSIQIARVSHAVPIVMESLQTVVFTVSLAPEPFYRLFFTERLNPPGIPPPDPRQPRAPPIV